MFVGKELIANVNCFTITDVKESFVFCILYTEIFDMAKTIDQKMDVDEESFDANDIEEKEERGRRLRKRRKSKEEEEEEEEEEMKEVKTSVTKLDSPPERQEHQKLKEHTICLANHTNSNDWFFRQLIMDRLNRWIIPQAEEGAEESYPDMDPESALEVILDERLPEIHQMAREFLRD